MTKRNFEDCKLAYEEGCGDGEETNSNACQKCQKYVKLEIEPADPITLRLEDLETKALGSYYEMQRVQMDVHSIKKEVKEFQDMARRIILDMQNRLLIIEEQLKKS